MIALSVTALETWRGVLLDQRSAAAMADLAASVGPWVQPTQGSFRPTTNYSADTHAGAGAIDISVNGWTRADENEYIRAARSMGWAAYVRAAIPGLWPRHIHQIMIPPSGNKRNDGGLSPGAWNQVRAYYNGRNGLANNGRDDGPRVTIRTYEQWLTATGIKELRTMDLSDKVPGTARLRPAGEKGGDLTIGQCLSRGAWAYQQLMPDGPIRRLIDLAYSRGTWAHNALLAQGYIATRLAKVEAAIRGLKK